MKSITLLLFCVAGLLLGVQGSCTVDITISARPGGSFLDNGVTNQIYDITSRNTGTEVITGLIGFFGFPQGNTITQHWNYDTTTGEISSFVNIFPGQLFGGAGFILAGTGVPTLARSLATCGGATQAPTQPPTTPPTQGPTQPPTTPPTTPPTQPPGACTASVVVNKRTNNGSFLENGVPSQIWDLVFTNTGSRAISDITITITPPANTIVNQNNKWNLVFSSATNSYAVQLFNSLASPNAQYTGAGFVIAGSTAASPVVAPSPQSHPRSECWVRAVYTKAT